MSNMREYERQGTVDVSARIQLTGTLLKRPFGHPSNRWTKRFFVIRDGFLMYYADAEKREYDRRKCFNIHPKGVIPLGGCTVELKSEPGQNYCLSLESTDYVEKVILSAENEFERDKWLNALKQACKINHENLQLGDNMIRQLESHGLQMAREKQDYYDLLQTEAKELERQKLKTEELEKVKEELEKEKVKMANYASDISEEYESLKQELRDTSDSLKSVEEDKKQLTQRTEGLQHNMQNLEAEKMKIVKEMAEGHTQRDMLSKEKESLSEATESMKQALKSVEEKMEQLDQERMEAENRIEENECRAEQLEKEKFIISQHAAELKESIKEISAQKAVTEAELKEEIVARLAAERRLKGAESSLNRLEKNVERPAVEASEKPAEELRQEMIGDVKTLKKFFENLAFEAKLDKDKPIMIKNSIHTKKNMVKRAKTMRHAAQKQKKTRPSNSTEDLAYSSLSQTVPADMFSQFRLDSPTSPTSSDCSLLRSRSTSNPDDSSNPTSPTSPSYRHSSVEEYVLRARDGVPEEFV